MTRPLLSARGLVKTFPAPGNRRRRLTAVAGVDLDLAAGESLALVGESGSGKTTLARLLTLLLEPDRGAVWFDGAELTTLPAGRLRRLRTQFQLVFQDAGTALDPRWTVGRQLAEPLALHRIVPRAAVASRVRELLALVELRPEIAGRLPHQLSGGERQRVGIARGLATEPRLLILDEPVSALDVTVRARVLALLAGLRERLGLTLLVIAHDLAMAARLCDRVAVLHRGELVEEGPREELFAHPRHAQTRALLAAVPRLVPRERPPAPGDRPGSP